MGFHTLEMHTCPFVQLEPFEWGWILRKYCTCWGDTFDMGNNGLMTIPPLVDQVLDGHVVQSFTKTDTLPE